MEDKYLLFSPIGNTDPISNYHDGAMLHIVRKYRPGKIYFYISKEMSNIHDKDDRYRMAVMKLGKMLGFTPEIHVYCNRELTDVHLFDYFYNEFEQRIKEIAEANSDCTILLNVSSGTPAMKSSLQTIAAISDNMRLIPVQVSTPTKSSNPRRDDLNKFDLETEWEFNEDNREGYNDRSEVSTTLNLSVRIKKESIVKHMEAYDYHAALSLANEISGYLSKDTLLLLEAANARIQLDIKTITKALAGTDHKIIPIEDSNIRPIAEYLLWLEVKCSKDELADFIRGITPLIADIFEMYTSKLLKKDFQQFFTKKNNGKRILCRRLLEADETGQKILEILDSNLHEGYRDGECSSFHLIQIIKGLSADKQVKDLADDIRKIEESCRNIAAHEIVSITREWIENKSGFSPDNIKSMIFRMADASGIPVSKLKDSYKKMNCLIKDSLMRL